MAGLWTMIRLILRRDRVKLPLWIIGLVLTLVAMIPLLRDVYGDAASLAGVYAGLSSNPAGLFMTGPVDGPTFSAFMTIETLLWWGLAIAFLNTLLIVRHTRHNEEIGAQELLLSGRAHRSSGLAAALIVAAGVNALIVLGIGVGVQLVGAPWNTSQTWLYALSLGIFGLVWASIATVIAQLVESSRSANGILAGLVGSAFVVRGLGDFLGSTDTAGLHQPAWISNLSPFGWMQATRPLTVNEWSPLLISACVVIAMTILGFILLARRDVGAGLMSSRKGKMRASRLRHTSLGLTLYLQKNIFIGWLVGVLVMVGTIGALVPQMSDVYGGSESMRQIIESIGGTGALIPSFLSAMMAIICLMVFAYVIHGLGKLRSEESSGYLESLLATRLSRRKWFGLHAAVVLAGGLIMLVLTGLILALCVNGLSNFSVDTRQYLLAGLSYAPVMLAFAGLYLLLFGLAPRIAAGVTWFYFGFVAFALWLGPIVQLNQSIMNLSIMEHVAAAPAESIVFMPLAIILAIATGLIAIGLITFRSRNITSD